MKDDQKLFDLFRDNEHKLREYPSPDAWQRLEQRLDAHRKRRRMRAIYRPLTLAAGLALILGVSAVILWSSEANMPQQARGHSHFVVLEDLPPSEGTGIYAQTQVLHEYYEEADLQEGSQGKQFRVNLPPQMDDATLPKRSAEN